MCVRRKFTIGKVRASVFAFSPKEARRSQSDTWSLKLLQSQEDADKIERKPLVNALIKGLSRIGVTEAFAPNVAPANARILKTRQLTSLIRLDKEISLYREEGRPADGLLLYPSETFIASAAGCPMILASGQHPRGYTHFIVAHAGRESLVDRGAAVHDKPTRLYTSVVDQIVATFRRFGVSSKDVTMLMVFAIPPTSFEHHPNHPVYGHENRRLVAFIKRHWEEGVIEKDGSAFLDLERIFMEQALAAGVGSSRTALRLDEYPDLIHTRSPGYREGDRNLIVVRREPLAATIRIAA